MSQMLPTQLKSPDELSGKDPSDKVLWEAEFNPKVKSYWLISTVLVCVVTVVLIPLIPIVCVIGLMITGKYLASHRCTLTETALKVQRGVFIRQEKTVPLDRITDLGLVQGPIMRMMDLEAISVETAGQSGPGSLVQLTGIRNGREFRDTVLKQRDRVVAREEAESGRATTSGASVDSSVLNTLEEIRDILRRIEQSDQSI